MRRVKELTELGELEKVADIVAKSVFASGNRFFEAEFC